MNLLLHDNYYFFFKKGNKPIEKGIFKIQKPFARKGFHTFHLLLLLSFLYAAMGSASAQTIHYVKAGATGSGTSWANASGDLQAMINGSSAGDQIWVAAGMYLPNRRADALTVITLNDRNNAFVLQKDVKIYGGFASTETDLTQRDSTRQTNNTILSSDLGIVNNNADNAYHVVISVSDAGKAELNGFTIKDGNADGDGSTITVSSKSIHNSQGAGIYNESSSPVLTNVSILGNNALGAGGGIYNSSSSPVLTNLIIGGNNANYGAGISDINSSPIITDVTISGNNSGAAGGGIYNNTSSPVLTNVIISGNNSALDAGGISNFSSSPVLTNVTISGNNADQFGGGIVNSGSSSPEIRNSIIYGNNGGIYNDDVNSVPTVQYSLVQDLSGITNGNMDGSTDPEFVNPVAYSSAPTTAGDYHITNNTSTVLNKGNNAYFDAGSIPDLHLVASDLDGNPRISGGTIDIGAYELQAIIKPDINGVVYVSPAGSGNFSGDNWSNASNDLQRSINATGVDQVWVAGGTYKPIHRADNMSSADANDRNNAFVLKKDVKIYGGFVGTEADLTQRDSTRQTNNTILTGDLGTVEVNTDNAYHVVISAGDAGTAELNGFTISGGNANGDLRLDIFITVNSQHIYNDLGGGIHNKYSSPLLSNITVSDNSATYYGCGIYNGGSSPVITNVIITGNHDGVAWGGGIATFDASPILTNVIISGNTANSGGGIFNQSAFPLLTNVIISGNQSGRGGGIYSIFSSSILTNVIISGNTANSGGGGGINNEGANPVLTNVVISGNTAAGGGGIFNFDCSPQIRNSIIQGNSSGIDGSSPIISYSLVQGLSDAGNGNIDGNTDPEFVSPVAAGLSTGGDYHLRLGSPAVNEGNNTYFDAGSTPDLHLITTDLSNNPRIVGGTIDMGAYESQSALPITLVSYTAQAEGKQSKLKWTTTAEFNNKEFTVLNATDGSHFTEIGKVAGAGNSNLRRDYVFYDANPAKGINYYSLQQTDYDGRTTQLGVRVVSFPFVNGNMIKVYPNPVKNIIQVEFDVNEYHQLELTDINGKVLQRLSLDNLDTRKKVDMGNLSSGIYFIKLVGDNGVESRKVVKE